MDSVAQQIAPRRRLLQVPRLLSCATAAGLAHSRGSSSFRRRWPCPTLQTPLPSGALGSKLSKLDLAVRSLRNLVRSCVPNRSSNNVGSGNRSDDPNHRLHSKRTKPHLLNSLQSYPNRARYRTRNREPTLIPILLDRGLTPRSIRLRSP